MTNTQVVPFALREAERLRYMGEEFSLDAVPERFRQTPIGMFDLRAGGLWYRCRGSWMDSEGDVWVWVALEGNPPPPEKKGTKSEEESE